MRKFLTRVCLWGGGALLLALASGAVVQGVLSHLALRGASAPGKWVDVDGRRVHLLCAGAGGPTVVLEAGLPDNSLTWASIIADIAEFARVCAYDRAGYGWSEAAPPPRTAGNIVRELRLLLQNAGIEPPYVLVGHSFGGLVVQLYAGRFPHEAAGMVLIDSAHPDQALRTAELERMDVLASGARILAPLGIPRFFMHMPVPAGSPQSRDAAAHAMEEELLLTTRSLRAMAAELAGLRESLQEAAAEPPKLGGKPLVVLTEGRRRAEFWHAMQEKLSGLSAAGEWQIAENAGHFIQHDRPELVVDAIRRVVESARSGAGSPR